MNRLKICAVCGYTLERFTEIDPPHAERFAHLRPWEVDDHVAVPVDKGSISHNARCDFCDHEGETPWLVLADDFIIDDYGSNSEGHWGACVECGPLVKRRRWTEIYSRLMATEASRPADQRVSNYEGRRAVTMAMWRRLEAHMHGVVPYREELNL